VIRVKAGAFSARSEAPLVIIVSFLATRRLDDTRVRIPLGANSGEERCLIQAFIVARVDRAPEYCESGSLRSCLEPVCRLEALRQSLAHSEDLA